MADQPEVDVRLISSGYLRTMHVPVIRGRNFEDSDAAGKLGADGVSALLVELGPGQTLVDLPYPPTATARAAEAAGAQVVDGLDVLVAQGSASFEMWTGLPAPVDVMRAAVRSA